MTRHLCAAHGQMSGVLHLTYIKSLDGGTSKVRLTYPPHVGGPRSHIFGDYSKSYRNTQGMEP